MSCSTAVMTGDCTVCVGKCRNQTQHSASSQSLTVLHCKLAFRQATWMSVCRYIPRLLVTYWLLHRLYRGFRYFPNFVLYGVTVHVHCLPCDDFPETHCSTAEGAAEQHYVQLPDTEFYKICKMNVGNADKIPFTNMSKAWLLLLRFSWNSGALNTF